MKEYFLRKSSSVLHTFPTIKIRHKGFHIIPSIKIHRILICKNKLINTKIKIVRRGERGSCECRNHGGRRTLVTKISVADKPRSTDDGGRSGTSSVERRMRGALRDVAEKTGI